VYITATYHDLMTSLLGCVGGGYMYMHWVQQLLLPAAINILLWCSSTLVLPLCTICFNFTSAYDGLLNKITRV